MVAPFLGGHWSVVVPPVVSASPMRHWADATLAPGLYRPEMLLYPDLQASGVMHDADRAVRYLREVGLLVLLQ